jgi:hypothetical protein
MSFLSLPWRGLARLFSINIPIARGGKGPDREPVVVYTAANSLEAEVIASRLAAEGIPCWQRGESLGHAYGLTLGPLAQVDILVPAALEEKARAILEIEDEDG